MFEKLCNDLDRNMKEIKDIFKDCEDISYREIELGEVFRIKVNVIFIGGLSDKDHISEYIIGSLLSTEEIKSLSLQGYRTTIIEAIAKEGLYTADLVLEKDFNKIINNILSGDTVLLIDGIDEAIVIDTKGWLSRGISEPQTETVIRGPRDGFGESLKTNITMVRRRIKDTKLKVKMHVVGRRSKTNIALMYMDDIVDKKIVDEVKKRLEKIDIDAILLGFISRNLGEMIKSFLLVKTPVEVIILVFILATSYIACYEIDVIARAGFIIFPIIVFFIIVIVLISIPKADFTNLLPLFQFDLKDIPKGINIAFFSYMGFEVCLFAIPYLEKREDSFKFTSIGILIVILMYVSIYIVTIAQFSIKQVERQTWPVLTLVKIVNLPG